MVAVPPMCHPRQVGLSYVSNAAEQARGSKPVPPLVSVSHSSLQWRRVTHTPNKPFSPLSFIWSLFYHSDREGRNGAGMPVIKHQGGTRIHSVMSGIGKAGT